MSLDSKRLMMDNFLSVIEGQKLDKKLSPEVYYCKQKNQCHECVWNASLTDSGFASIFLVTFDDFLKVLQLVPLSA